MKRIKKRQKLSCILAVCLVTSFSFPNVGVAFGDPDETYGSSDDGQSTIVDEYSEIDALAEDAMLNEVSPLDTTEDTTEDVIVVETAGNEVSIVFETKTGTLRVTPKEGTTWPFKAYTYQQNYEWAPDVRCVIVEDGMTAIPNYAFKDFTNTESVILPATLVSLGSSSFTNLTQLTSISIGEGANLDFSELSGSEFTFGGSAFMGCTDLSGQLILPKAAITFKGKVFMNCTGLTGVTIPEGASIAGELPNSSSTPFGGCTGLLEENTLNYAEWDAADLDKLGIPAPPPPPTDSGEKDGIAWTLTESDGSVTLTLSGTGSIPALRDELKEQYARYGADEINEVVIQEGIIGIDYSAFENWTSLASVSFPTTLESLGTDAFFGSGLESIEFPEGSQLTSIGQSAFGGCPNLTSVDLTNLPIKTLGCETNKGIQLFTGSPNVSSLRLPSGLETFGNLLLWEEGQSSALPLTTESFELTIPNSVTLIYASNFVNCRISKLTLSSNAALNQNLGTGFKPNYINTIVACGINEDNCDLLKQLMEKTDTRPTLESTGHMCSSDSGLSEEPLTMICENCGSIVTVSLEEAESGYTVSVTSNEKPVYLEAPIEVTLPIPEDAGDFVSVKLGDTEEKWQSVQEGAETISVSVTETTTISVAAVKVDEGYVQLKAEEVDVEQASVPEVLGGKYEDWSSIQSACVDELKPLDKDVNTSNTKMYDIKLVDENGNVVEASDIPAGGVDVVLDVPEEAVTPEALTFRYAHMFENVTDSFRVGEIETGLATYKDGRLYFHLSGFSPVAISWTGTTSDTENGTNDTDGTGGTGGTSGTGQGSGSTNDTDGTNDSENGTNDTDGTSDAAPTKFDDVDYDAYYGDAVTFVAAKGLIKGYSTDDGDSTNIFGVGNSLTRAEFATILWRYAEPEAAAAYDGKAINETNLPDVESGSFYTAAANWALKNGVVMGVEHEDGSRTFEPHETITFEQMLVIVGRLCATDAGLASADVSALSTFVDGDEVSEWATHGLAWAVQNKLVSGYEEPDGRYLKASENVPRERAATILYNAYDVGLFE